MSSPLSNLDELLLGLPIVGILLMGFFRLDELVAKPRARATLGHPLSHRDNDGYVVCIEPDGHYVSTVAGDSGNDQGTHQPVRRPGHLPSRRAVKTVQRVSIAWQEGMKE